MEFAVLGMTLGHATRNFPVGVSIAALRHAASRFGPAAPGRMLRDRGDLDYNRFFVSTPKVAGQRIADLQLPPELQARIRHLRRSDADLDPLPERQFEFGDRVGIPAPRSSFPPLAKIFGASVRATAEVSYIGMGVGVTLGLGLRNFRLTLFLAVVGISSGATFAATIAQSGLLSPLLGSAIVAVPVAVTLLIALWVFRLPFDTAAGIVAGVTGSPAILSFANRIASTDRPDAG